MKDWTLICKQLMMNRHKCTVTCPNFTLRFRYPVLDNGVNSLAKGRIMQTMLGSIR